MLPVMLQNILSVKLALMSSAGWEIVFLSCESLETSKFFSHLNSDKQVNLKKFHELIKSKKSFWIRSIKTFHLGFGTFLFLTLFNINKLKFQNEK